MAAKKCSAICVAGYLADQRLKYFAGPADLHFFFPVFLSRSVANGTIDKPAQLTGTEFPCRAFSFLLGAAFFDLPA
jgi:hypothetical protein